MPTAHGCDSPTTSTREGDGFLDLSSGLWADIKLGGRVKGTCPCVMGMVSRGSERYSIVELVELGGDCGVHCGLRRRLEELE